MHIFERLTQMFEGAFLIGEGSGRTRQAAATSERPFAAAIVVSAHTHKWPRPGPDSGRQTSDRWERAQGNGTESPRHCSVRSIRDRTPERPAPLSSPRPDAARSRPAARRIAGALVRRRAPTSRRPARNRRRPRPGPRQCGSVGARLRRALLTARRADQPGRPPEPPAPTPKGPCSASRAPSRRYWRRPAGGPVRHGSS